MWDSIKNALGGGAKTPSIEEVRAERARKDLELALRYGTRFPNPKPPKLASPGFWVGSCDAMTYSPTGEHLVVPTNNGDFLWEVATGTKGSRLKGVTNQLNFVFSADGKMLLARNEQSEFARFVVPTGELIGKCKAKYELRMDGRATLAGDGSVILQMAYQGMFLMLEASTGKVLLQRQLEPTGCNAQIHWLPESQEVIVTQASVVNRHNQGRPSAIWRWRWPLDQHEPERMKGDWDYLTSELDRAKGLLLLHYRAEGQPRGAASLERIRLSDWKSLRVDDCSDSIIPRPSLSHDGTSWAVHGNRQIEIRHDEQLIAIPALTGGATFHPKRDLVAVSGETGFVAPLSVISGLMPHLLAVDEAHTLRLRGYARGTTLPGRKLPPRLILWRIGESSWQVEQEAIDGRHYIPTRPFIDVIAEEELGQRLLELSNHPPQAHAATAERRQLSVGALTPPSTNALSGVAITFASDAIELYPLKPEAGGSFRIHWDPVAAIAPDSTAERIASAAIEMLGHYRPKRAAR